VIIDWHNLGYSMLEGGLIRRVAEAFERRMAPLADGHIIVTRAMKEFLAREMELPPSSLRVVPDCPPTIFRPRPLREQHEILSKLHPGICRSVPATWSTNASVDNGSNGSGDVTTTLLTEYDCSSNVYRARRGRPAFVTSSTSWTPDEDFGVLLSALLKLDAKIDSEVSSLRVLVVVTGKGPQKREYEDRMSQLQLRNVAVQTLWLEPADYPKLLACADVGVSLHTSTSGLDLPMKVLDLFGCEAPVCALNFGCLSELVEDRGNGRVFESSDELSELLWELLSPLTADPSAPAHGFGPLATYSANLKGLRRWDDQWKENVLPFLLKTIEDSRL
jgi:beta-1,4-mannosyltransferase